MLIPSKDKKLAEWEASLLWRGVNLETFSLSEGIVLTPEDESQLTIDILLYKIALQEFHQRCAPFRKTLAEVVYLVDCIASDLFVARSLTVEKEGIRHATGEFVDVPYVLALLEEAVKQAHEGTLVSHRLTDAPRKGPRPSALPDQQDEEFDQPVKKRPRDPEEVDVASKRLKTEQSL